MEMEYVCRVPIDHTADHCIYPVGAIIKLNHLAPEMVQRLMDAGYVETVIVAQDAGMQAAPKVTKPKS